MRRASEFPKAVRGLGMEMEMEYNSADMEFELEGEGTLLWNLVGGHLHSFELTGEAVGLIGGKKKEQAKAK